MSLQEFILPKKNRIKSESLPKETVIDLETPQCTCIEGSLTVEAAFILPMLSCFFAFFLFFFRVMLVQIAVQEALEDTGRILAIMAEKESEDGAAIEHAVLAKTILTAKLYNDENVKHYVLGEALGVSLIHSAWDKEDLILEANYLMKFPVALVGKKYFRMSQMTSFRRWTGWYPISLEQAEEMTIYVTINGEAYHRRKSCPYIALSIQSVNRKEIVNLRNNNGEKYSLCESCGKEAPLAEMVYITNYGTRYHSSRACSGLKRTVCEVKYSELGGKHPCPKCWK